MGRWNTFVKVAESEYSSVSVESTEKSSLYLSVTDSQTFHQNKSVCTPCIKFRKYFEMRQLSENTFQSFNMEVYEKFFLVEILVF